MEKIQEILLQSSGLTFEASLLSNKSVVGLTGVPFSSQEGSVAVVALHVLLEVYFPLLHCLLGFIRGEGTGRVKFNVMCRHDQDGAGIHGEEKGEMSNVLLDKDQERCRPY